MSRIGGHEVSAVVGADAAFQWSCHHGLQVSRFSRTGPVAEKSLSRYDRNSGGGCFVFFNFGTVDVAVSKEAPTHQALPPALFLET